jgi:alkyldihydroxyacetonephosphate synthase
MPDNAEISSLCKEIQVRQQSRILVSDFHVKSGSLSLSIPEEIIMEALRELGICTWPAFGKTSCNLSPPQSQDLQWAAMLHCAHAFAPLLVSSHPKWASWLSPSSDPELNLSESGSKVINIVVEKLMHHFDAVDRAVEDVINNLERSGFVNPGENHIVQYLPVSGETPLFLMRVAIKMRTSSAYQNTPTQLAYKTQLSIRGNLHAGNSTDAEPLFHPTVSFSPEDNSESLGAWGYRDSYFVLNVGHDGSKYVVLKGNRYAISGKKLPRLAKFVEDQLKCKINPNDITFPAIEKLPNIANSAMNVVLSEVASVFGDGMNQVSAKPHDRARNGTGHTQEDMYALRSGSLGFRLPDLVVWPKSTDEVKSLVSTAIEKDWCLIPFGGGTNVTHATHCPDNSVDPRPMISVDMKLMNNVIWVNKEDGLAHVEAGITGRQLIEYMSKLGLTIGHEPDSYEFSTLGGWIATKASGMKQNRYGNIEDIVKEVTVVGTNGVVSNTHLVNQTSFGRVSTGIDFKSIILGSEGCMGIIVSAVIKVWPTAESTLYESVLLPDLDTGLRFVKAMSKLHTLKPASVRLLDNDQFRLGQALKPQTSRFDLVKTALSRQIGFLYGNLCETSVVCATITFEGSCLEVQMQKKLVHEVAVSHSGILAGASIGKAGYDLTFSIAYLRDFALNYNILGESFETFVPWSRLRLVIEKTKRRIYSEHRQRSLPGDPFVCCRVTQLYDEGACVYFYFCMNINGVTDPSKKFASIEECARQEILDTGGSLSHHHGLGKLRAPFVRQIYSDEYMDSIIAIKNALDPKNIFGAGNGVLHNHHR